MPLAFLGFAIGSLFRICIGAAVMNCVGIFWHVHGWETLRGWSHGFPHWPGAGLIRGTAPWLC